MATNRIDVDAPIAAVWAVLADAPAYPRFVVGTSHVRHHDETWPELGARLHHAIGFWPFLFRDCTSVEVATPPSSLLLRAGMSITGASDVRFTLEPTETGTRVTIEEHPARGPIKVFWNPLFDALMHVRNRELLRRLARLVEARATT